MASCLALSLANSVRACSRSTTASLACVVASSASSRTKIAPLPFSFHTLACLCGTGAYASGLVRRAAGRNCLKILSTSQPPYHQPCHRRIDERFSGCAQPLVILAHPPVLREPAEGPLHYPSAG